MEKRLNVLSAESRSQISSGTVIICLATAVKELVENSLDAGATVVDVRLTEFGTEVIEVADNGNGVEEEDFEALVLKSHTSKLLAFEDLQSVESFGFRGEALSALCTLSDLTVHTRVVSSSSGFELTYDHCGKMTKKEPMQKQPGTTLFIRNLFSNLPVRRDQFKANLRQQLAKMLRVLHGYGIIMGGVRLSCSNLANGKSACLLRTSGHAEILQNIIDIFGPKQKLTLLKMCVPTPDILEEYNLTEDELSHVYTIDGWISDCQHGSGRSTNDRQFLFINKRPCEYPKVTKLINEVYREFNVKDCPFYAIDIQLDRESVDVNVVPTKNQVLVEHEKLLLATIKATIRGTFGSTPANVPLISLDLSQSVFQPVGNKPSVQTPSKFVPDSGGASYLDRFKFGASSAGPYRKTSLHYGPSGKKGAKTGSGKKRTQPSTSADETPDRKMMKFFRASNPHQTVDISVVLEDIDEPQGTSVRSVENSFHPAAPVYRNIDIVGSYGSQVQETDSVVDGERPETPQIFSQFLTDPSQAPKNSTPKTHNGFGSQPFSPVGFNSDGLRRAFYKTPIPRPVEEEIGDGFTLDFSKAPGGREQPENDPQDLETVLGEISALANDVAVDFPGSSSGVSFTTMGPVTGPFHQPYVQQRQTYSMQDEPMEDGVSVSDPQNEMYDGLRDDRDDDDSGFLRVRSSFMDDYHSSLNTSVHPGRRVVATNFGQTGGVAQTSRAVLSSAFKSPSPLCKKLEAQNPRSLKTQQTSESSIRSGRAQSVLPSASRSASSTVTAPSGGETPVSLQQMENRPTVTVDLSLEKIKLGFKIAQDSRDNDPLPSASQHVFQAGITPPQNESAELELQRNIKKADFLAMKVIGQFNNGFIVAQLDQDFFLIDQHASDERFNYEALQESFTVQTQPLVSPYALELSAMDETILFDNEEIFLKNGFKFFVDNEKDRDRVSLISAPLVHKHTLGKEDIIEMIHILSETKGVNIRPSRVLPLIASKACRKSIMIGDSLNVTQMSKIISNMAGLLEPWKCAHGRPTMRHLFNLTDLET